MWADHAIWWQVYPLGFTGCGVGSVGRASTRPVGELAGLRDRTWLLRATTGPVFASETHGYDTVDHFRIDPRLGDDADFDRLVEQAHSAGCGSLLDGVFNHVARSVRRAAGVVPPPGRRFARHLRRARAAGRARSQSAGGGAVRRDVLCHWLDRGVDAWRLDVAYAVPAEFWRAVLPRGERIPDAWFFGEVIHGDYAGYVAKSGAGLGHAVRAVEGDLELAERRQLLRARLRPRGGTTSCWTRSCRRRSSATTT